MKHVRTDRTLAALQHRVRRYALPLVIVAATLVAVPGAPSVGTPPEADVRAVPLSFGGDAAPVGGRSAAATTRWRVAPEVPAGDAVMVGATWQGDTVPALEVRARTGSTWTAWEPLPFDADHAPDTSTAEGARARLATDPVWFGEVDAYEVRQDGTAIAVDLQLVDAIGGDGLAYEPLESRGVGGFAQAATTQPAIISRASWGADESLRSYVPLDAGEVRFTVVHHTAGRNAYTPEESDDIVRSIYAYHTRTRGWDDIGYNFLIDAYGRVYEGRAGGIDKAIIGAHAAGWNTGSAGISVMGDFTSTDPTPATVTALKQLVAWRLDDDHVDPHSTTTERSGGGSTNRYDDGVDISLPAIIGHRHTNNTSCPGDRLYAHVTELADDVAPIGTPKAYGGLRESREQPNHGIRPRWDVTFSEPLEWRLRITGPDGVLVRSTGGFAASTVDLTWDLRDSAGELVPPGTYRSELTAWYADRYITPVTTDILVTPPVERSASNGRIGTAVELSQRYVSSASRVVLASAEAYPDALVASPLAGSLGSPVLLLPQDHIPAEVVAEIRRLASDRAYIVGGPGRLSPAIEDQLVNELGISRSRITRLAGPDRFATARAVAKVVVDREHPKQALIALGAHADPGRAFPDALSAGAFGAALGLPVVLVEPDRLPAASAELLSSRPWADGLLVFGGSGAVSDRVVAEAVVNSGAGAQRLAGGSRYETSAMAADELLRRWDAKAQAEPPLHPVPTGLELVMASGDNWPDALGAGAVAARRGAPFLLTSSSDLEASTSTRDWLQAHADVLAHVVLAGGPGAVSETVAQQTGAIVASAGYHAQPNVPWAPDPWAESTKPSPGPTGTPGATASPGWVN